LFDIYEYKNINHEIEENASVLFKKHVKQKIINESKSGISAAHIMNNIISSPTTAHAKENIVDFTDILPTSLSDIQNISNYSKRLMNATSNNINTNAELLMFLNDQIVTPEAWNNEIDLNKMCIVTLFDGIDMKHSLNITDTIAGFSFCSKNMIEFLENQMENSKSGINLNIDGTYKLIKNGWVLLILSGYNILFKKGNFVHSAKPLMFTLVNVEKEASYKACLDSLDYVGNNFVLYFCIFVYFYICIFVHLYIFLKILLFNFITIIYCNINYKLIILNNNALRY